MASKPGDIGFTPSPATLAEVIFNLRLMMASDVVLSDQIFDTVFLSEYFAGENFRFFDKDGRKDVMITHFDRLVQKEPVNTASLADAFIAIGRVVTSDGTTNVDLRVNLESGEREKNSIDYEVLERVLGAKLTLRDPIDLAHYFPIPTKILRVTTFTTAH